MLSFSTRTRRRRRRRGGGSGSGSCCTTFVFVVVLIAVAVVLVSASYSYGNDSSTTMTTTNDGGDGGVVVVDEQQCKMEMDGSTCRPSDPSLKENNNVVVVDDDDDDVYDSATTAEEDDDVVVTRASSSTTTRRRNTTTTKSVTYKNYDNDVDEYYDDLDTSLLTEDIDVCTVYMAPSTLGDATSLGIYTGIDMKANQVIRYPEIVVPILFREWGEHVDGIHDGVLWDRYIWEGDVVDVESYDDTNRLDTRAAFIPGIGCTVNSIMDLHNIDSTHRSLYDTTSLHRSRDPGSGAFTPYHSSKTVAIQDIQAGSELFAEYGDYWIPDIEGVQITLNDEMDHGEDFLQNVYIPFIEKYRTELNDHVLQGLWEYTVDESPLQPQSRSQSTLPRNVSWKNVYAYYIEQQQQQQQKKQQLDDEQNQQQQKQNDDSVKNIDDEDDDDNTKPRFDFSLVREFYMRNTVRDVDWLKVHGYCQDHMKPGNSNIKQAGRGAFATRPLPKGSIVGYAPLVHMGIHGRDVFTIKEYQEFDEKMKQYNPERNQGHQPYDLIINYSFGHPNSTVILTPYGGMVNYINHAPSPDMVNVQVRWPNKELTAHKPDWLTKTPYEMTFLGDKISLSFEYVALRDIQPNEEIYIDYGTWWEDAWNKHVQDYTTTKDEHSYYYVHSSEWKENYFRTVDEQKNNPYPMNLVTMCIDSYTTQYDDMTGTPYHTYMLPLRQGPDRLYCNIIDRQQVTVVEDEEEEAQQEDDDDVEHDDVEHDEEGPTTTTTTTTKFTYTVELIYKNNNNNNENENVAVVEDEEKLIVYEYDEESIFLYDRAYSADWHLPNAFRHLIQIPDDIMPTSWFNKKNHHNNGDSRDGRSSIPEQEEEEQKKKKSATANVPINNDNNNHQQQQQQQQQHYQHHQQVNWNRHNNHQIHSFRKFVSKGMKGEY